jgi:hypothetical protein
MDYVKAIAEKYECKYIENYKKTWLKAKLVSSDDLLSIAKELKKRGLAFSLYGFTYRLFRRKYCRDELLL